MMVELSFMFIIILGRWILPKGNISHSALSQLLLVYLSLASDILDLLTLFNEHEIQISPSMVQIVLSVFSLCMLQFALNLTATRGRSFRAEFDQTEIEIHQPAPSEVLPPLTPKPVPRHRQFLSKFLSRSTSSAIDRSPTDERKPPPLHTNSPAAKVIVIDSADSISENRETMKHKDTFLNTTHLSSLPASPSRLQAYSYPSTVSLNSVHSSIINPSYVQKRPRKRSLGRTVKFFVLTRSKKFFHSEIWSIIVTLALQDGPFFAVRLTAIIVYHVRSFLTYFFTFKNFLILVFQSYRIAAICFEKDENEPEFKEKISKMKRMSIAATQLGIPLNRKI